MQLLTFKQEHIYLSTMASFQNKIIKFKISDSFCSHEGLNVETV